MRGEDEGIKDEGIKDEGIKGCRDTEVKAPSLVSALGVRGEGVVAVAHAGEHIAKVNKNNVGHLPVISNMDMYFCPVLV